MDTDNGVVMARGKGGGAGGRCTKGRRNRGIGNRVNNKNEGKKNEFLKSSTE